MDAVPGETRTLRRTMRDLVALSALPAVWAGYRPLQVAEGLADVLRSTLRLDLVYIRLPGQTEGRGIEVARTTGGSTPTDQTRDIGRALAPRLDGAGADSALPLPNPAGPGTVRVIAVPIGCGRLDGVLVAGSQRTAFPSEEDRLLLSVAANQAAVVLQRERDEEALRESEERYRSVITAMQEGVILLGADGRIRACNASAERILGLSAGEMMGRTPLDPRWQAIHEDGSAFPAETFPVMETLRTGRPCSNVVMGVCKPTGELTWISINSQPLLRGNEPRMVRSSGLSCPLPCSGARREAPTIPSAAFKTFRSVISWRRSCGEPRRRRRRPTGPRTSSWPTSATRSAPP
jgi:PAS domain S-box-containing protein